ncbi:MAG TPA: type II toxin-antitoxin system RelE/ParE family toxin [Dehalococcoidia bacterium]|nr:type II toxin-antitoxin system RelE/ParE family toxin [Dehalococcoidia bacterium]
MTEVVLYADARGEEPVYDYIERLGRSRPAEAAAIERYIDLLEEKGERLRYPFASAIDKKDRLFQLRPGNHRIAYGLHEGKYVLVHAWRKQSQKLDARELGTARRRFDDWKRRHPPVQRHGAKGKGKRQR